MSSPRILAGGILVAFAISTALGNAAILTQVFNTGTLTPLSAGDTDTATTQPGAATLASDYAFGAPSSPSGTIVSWALTGDSLNPYGVGDQTFVYQLADFNAQVNVLDLSGFNLSSVYVGFNGSGVAPVDASLNNGVLDFSFSSVISPGQISDYLYVYTSATVPSNSTADAVDSSNSTTSSGAPILAPVPEPSALAMLLVGFASLGVILKHRRSARQF